MTMHAFDASTMIHALDNYPPKQFPRLWDWLKTELRNGKLIISRVAYDESIPKLPEEFKPCLKEFRPPTEKDYKLIAETMKIKNKLVTEDGNFHSPGVCENDLFIIVHAKLNKATLLTEEARQISLPNDKRKYKIPAVCKEIAGISCVNFTEYIRSSGEIF